MFDTTINNFTLHISNFYKEGELEENLTSKDFLQVQIEGNRKVRRNVKVYNLDMIISIEFRVNSKKAIKFRTWANKIIKDYMVQGFALNYDRFMKARKSDQEYFKRLLERIKLICQVRECFIKKLLIYFPNVLLIMIRIARFHLIFTKLFKISFTLL